MSLFRRGPLGRAALLLLTIAPAQVSAQTVTLAEQVAPGDCFRIEIGLTVDGAMKVERDGKRESLPLKAKAGHTFFEVVEAAGVKGEAGMTVRHYLVAASEADLGVERTKRELSADRRLIVAKRTADGTAHFSPNGPLGRDELDLVAEHFDTLCVPGLLPGSAVKVGDTWPIPPEVAQHACLFEGIVKNELVGKLVAVTDGTATFFVTGTAEGVEFGARAVVTITATGTFDTVTKRITGLTWEQADARDQGPASPATDVKATVTLKRTPQLETPTEVGAAARGKLPADGKPTDLMLSIRYSDPAGRYAFVHARDWHVVGRTRDHLVLRLMEKGEFTAQATVTAWKKADPGRHTSPEEFKTMLAKLPGWTPEGESVEGEVPTDPGRWLYRVAARGKQDGQQVVQFFYLLAGPTGDQVAVTVVTKP
ncbi:MAG: hypothetical protein ACRC7O_18085, partial [Fimbriiglobus sp.]